jgi:hypothetical protein
MKITLPLASVLFAVLMAAMPGSLGDPEGTCPANDVTTVYLPDDQHCEYEIIKLHFCVCLTVLFLRLI